MQTKETEFAWVFDSKNHRILGHVVGCQAVPTTEKLGAKLIFLGVAEDWKEDNVEDYRFCKCTKGHR
jgi:hypothetical protein